jgi:HD-like signal output (HDOD) protein
LRDDTVSDRVKFAVDEELWYGTSSDEQAEAHAAQSMAARVGSIVGAKPFPAAASRLSQITQNPNCLMDEVVSVLESDPALSANLLRLVNSVGFSLRTPCTSVRHAATLVGTEKLHQVASTAAILDMYESSSAQASRLLEHATVVGALCRYLGFHFGLPPDELFTCGFLHDIGKLMLLDTEGDAYLALLERERPQFDTLFVEERKLYGFDHALLAGHVLAAWNIPHPVPKVVAWHHHVTRAYGESSEISKLVSTLRLADAMSYALVAEDRELEIQNLAKSEAASYMDISAEQLAVMWDEVRTLTDRARAVFLGEALSESEVTHTSRPSAASLRAVASAKKPERPATSVAIVPALSERPNPYPCVVCRASSEARRCAACHGYACALHLGPERWCQLCQKAYRAQAIAQIRPAFSILVGAALGALVALAFCGAAAAGAQQPMKLMWAPTVISMLLGTGLGASHRWVQRWWFLRTRPKHASVIPATVEALLGSAQQQIAKIVELSRFGQYSQTPIANVAAPQPHPAAEPEPKALESDGALSLSHPEFPASPALPTLDAHPAPPAAPDDPPKERESSVVLAMQRASARREQSWMSNAPHTPRPASAPSDVPTPAAPDATAALAEMNEGQPVLASPGRSAPPDPDYEPELLVSDHAGETSAEVESWEALERELEEPAEEPLPDAATLALAEEPVAAESTAAESHVAECDEAEGTAADRSASDARGEPAFAPPAFAETALAIDAEQTAEFEPLREAPAPGFEPTLLDLDRLLAEQDAPAQRDEPTLVTSSSSPEAVLVPEVREPATTEERREPEIVEVTRQAEKLRGVPLPIHVPEPLAPFPPSRSLPARDGRVRRSRTRGRSGESATRDAAVPAPKAQPRPAEPAQRRTSTTPSRVAAESAELPTRAAGAALQRRSEAFEAPLARTSAAVRIVEEPGLDLPASAAHPLAESADAVPELPESAVLPVAERHAQTDSSPSAPKGAWKDLLDGDGTASGW